MHVKNILEDRSSTFMEKFYLRDQSKILLFLLLFSFPLLPVAMQTVRASKQGSTYNISTVLLVRFLKEISREGNLLNNYLYVQEDEFFDTKVLKSTKFEVIF